MPRYLVLGAGRIGAVVAADLAGDVEAQVRIADVSEGALQAATSRCGAVRPLQADLSRPDVVRGLCASADVVVGALPSRLGFAALAAVVEAGKRAIDLSFTSEDPLTLDARARETGATVVVDLGVAPGMSHLLAAHGVARLGGARSVRILVGGIPRDRDVLWSFKAAFAPGDVVEEYTRPARVVAGGVVTVVPALSGRERIELEGVGELEAATTDGLRTLARSLAIPEMVEKTLRWPGHYAQMETLRDSGFFSAEPVRHRGGTSVPLEVTRELLARAWTYAPGEEDLTVMRVEVDGPGGRVVYDLVDTYERASGTTSMARTTAFPCAIAARLIAGGLALPAGVHPPERLAALPGLVDLVLAEHARRGVHYRVDKRPLKRKIYV